MQPLPYLPLYVRDFISDPLVLSMTWIQQGIYLRMLMLSWEAGPLPDDTILIGRMIGWRELWWCPGGDQQSRPDRYDECEAISGVLSLCWEQGEQGWVQPRLEAERARGMALSEARSVAGRKGAESKHGKARRLPEQSHSKRVASQAQTQAHTQTQVQVENTDSSSLRSELPAPRRRGRRKGQVLTMPVEDANTPSEASKRPVTPQAELLEFWASEWQRTRGAAWASRKQDYILAAKVLALEGSSLPEAKARATRLLENGQDAWLAQNASVELLLRRWNNLAFEVKNGRHAEGAGERLARELREAGIEVTR